MLFYSNELTEIKDYLQMIYLICTQDKITFSNYFSNKNNILMEIIGCFKLLFFIYYFK